MLKTSKGFPLSVFSALRLFFGNFFTLQFFDVLQQWMLKNAKGPSFSGHLARQFRRLGFSWVWYSFCEFFDTFMSFCYFWALDMAPTYAVPGLLYMNICSPHLLSICWKLDVWLAAVAAAVGREPGAPAVALVWRWFWNKALAPGATEVTTEELPPAADWLLKCSWASRLESALVGTAAPPGNVPEMTHLNARVSSWKNGMNLSLFCRSILDGRYFHQKQGWQ